MWVPAGVLRSFGLILAASALPALAQDGAVIPSLHGSSLSGEAVSLPDALKGRAGVLIVGFSQASGTETAAWGRRLAADPQRPAGLLYFELPMLQGVPKLLRWWVLKQIRKEVSPAGQVHFIPVEDHEAEWKKAAGFSRRDAAYVLVVDGGGVVRARVSGPVSDGDFAAVEQKAAAILAAH